MIIVRWDLQCLCKVVPGGGTAVPSYFRSIHFAFRYSLKSLAPQLRKGAMNVNGGLWNKEFQRPPVFLSMGKGVVKRIRKLKADKKS